MRLRFWRMASAFLPVCGTGGMLGSTPDTFICLRFSMFCWAVAAIGSASASDKTRTSIPDGLMAGICLLLDEVREPTSCLSQAGATRVSAFYCCRNVEHAPDDQHTPPKVRC